MNNLQIEDIINTIDDNSSFDSSNPHKAPQQAGHSTNNSSATLIERLEMPTPTLYPLVSVSSGARNHRKKKPLLLKLVAFSAILLVAFFAMPILHSQFFSRTDKKLKYDDTIYDTSGRKENADRYGDGDGLPDYAPVKQNLGKENVLRTETLESKPHAPDTKESVSEKPAYERLQCPTSVLNFVINATDAKDECDGLRKAFDHTCGGVKEEKSDGHLRRMLREIYDSAEESAWLDSIKSTVNRITPQFPSRRLLGTDIMKKDKTSSSVEDDDKSDATEKNNEKTEVKHLSPSLPTGMEHMSDTMAEDALGLNSELSDIAKAIEEIGNSTETTDNDKKSSSKESSNSKYKEKESATSKDITSAAVAVSAIMNRPEVIETQSCCRSILQVFHDECDSPDDEEYADRRLFVIVCVIGLCGMIKSLIRHFKIRWLPEAGGCILVGVIGGLFLKILPNIDFAFSHDMFLRVMVPPIVFEAALNINKKSFQLMLVPIVMLALFGTIMSTLLTAAIVFYGTGFIQQCTSIPFIESLTFGSLISSIDPIAVLSVLSNMGMSDKDQIYVIIFGESLLNDGVAIVLFQTLLNFMDENFDIDGEAVYLATIQFLVIAFGSLFVGLASGVSATLYFWLMQGIQTPLVEVIMFICWAFIPYYVCDGIEWSGIVAIVAVGFFMDLYIIGHKNDADTSEDAVEKSVGMSGKKRPVRHAMFSQRGFLSAKAKNHIRFVTEINSTLMETAIFSYLGIFLFNKRYHWNFWIPVVAIIGCLFSRALTVWFFSFVSNVFNRVSAMSARKIGKTCGHNNDDTNERPPNPIIIDSKMQTVLIFAGLRGAMSFALVETIPMFDESTRQGSRFKPELKAMTSACIVFTVFILGGYTDYLLEKVGMKPSEDDSQDVEMVSLIRSMSDDITDQTDQWESTGELKQRSAATRAIVNDDRIVKMW